MPEAIRRAPTPTSPSRSDGWRSRCRPRTWAGTSASRRPRRSPSPWASRSTMPPISANIFSAAPARSSRRTWRGSAASPPWLKVAHLAETFNVPICPHFLMELHVSLCAAVPNAPWGRIYPAADAGDPCRDDGARRPGPCRPTRRAFGIEWDIDALARFERTEVAGDRPLNRRNDMQRIGMVIRVRPEKRDEYIRLHAQVWAGGDRGHPLGRHPRLLDLPPCGPPVRHLRLPWRRPGRRVRRE